MNVRTPNRTFLRLFWLALLVVASWSRAAEIGMPAPELRIADWVKGEKITLAEGKGKNIYVIEFWATWCGPCKTSIPHLTELQKKYKSRNVVVIGVTDEMARDVQPFVDKMGSQMDYVVAVDAASQTSNSYLKAFDQNGIPYAFVIDKTGAIVWHGHPMSGLDETVAQVVAGTFKNDTARKASHARALVEEYLELVKQEEKDPKTDILAKQILEDGGQDARLLNEFAWNILMKWSVRQRDIPLAFKAAQRAVQLTDSKEPAALDTCARALFMSGKKDEAILMQKQAISIAASPAAKEKLQAVLDEYQK